MKLEHYFKTTSHDLVGLFNGVTKFSTFCYRLEKQAELNTDRYPRDKYVGDGFEFFVELFIKYFKNDNRIGIHEYRVNNDIDMGVDGFGLNMALEKCAIQVKYRSNNTQELSGHQDHLDSFITEALLNHGVKPPKQLKVGVIPTLYIFTSAKGLYWKTNDVKYQGKIKVISYNDIRKMVDNNLGFWEDVYQISLQNN
jgi:hypothetical protein